MSTSPRPSGGTSGSTLERQLEQVDAGRSPDGVYLDLPAYVPDASTRAPATQVVALSQTIDEKDIRQLLTGVLEAIRREDLERLNQFVSEDVSQLGQAGRSGGRMQILELWNRRFSSLDYSKLGELRVFRFDAMRRYSPNDVPNSEKWIRRADLNEGDVIVSVPIETTVIGSDKYFAARWVLVLRRVHGKAKIAGYGESED